MSVLTLTQSNAEAGATVNGATARKKNRLRKTDLFMHTLQCEWVYE